MTKTDDLTQASILKEVLKRKKENQGYNIYYDEMQKVLTEEIGKEITEIAISLTRKEYEEEIKRLEKELYKCNTTHEDYFKQGQQDESQKKDAEIKELKDIIDELSKERFLEAKKQGYGICCVCDEPCHPLMRVHYICIEAEWLEQQKADFLEFLRKNEDCVYCGRLIKQKIQELSE